MPTLEEIERELDEAYENVQRIHSLLADAEARAANDPQLVEANSVYNTEVAKAHAAFKVNQTKQLHVPLVNKGWAVGVHEWALQVAKFKLNRAKAKADAREVTPLRIVLEAAQNRVRMLTEQKFIASKAGARPPKQG